MNLPGAEVFWAAAQPPPPATASLDCLPLSSLLFALCKDQEPRPKKGGWGEVLRAATCHSSRAPCNTGLVVRVKAHARTHAHTHQAARSRPPRPPPLRPSALPPVKTRRSALPSLRAPGREQALQVTSNLANEKLTSYRRGCNNGHTALRFCPFRPVLQTVIQSGRGGGGLGAKAASPTLLHPGK